MNPRRKHGRNRSSGRIYFQNAANELTGITRNNELTVAGSLTNTPTSISINGQSAGIYNDHTFAASGVSLNDGMNTFTAIMVTAGGSFTNSTTKTLPASVSLTSDLNGNLKLNIQTPCLPRGAVPVNQVKPLNHEDTA
jgi:hypothetical protein